MALFGRKKTTVGLDIGSGFVKLVAVDRSSGDPVVVQVGMSPMVPDAIVEGEVMDPGLVADTIRSLFESTGIKSPDVVTAVGGHDVIVKKIAMDRMKEADAQQVIRWEGEQHVPFDMESVQLDFQILDPLDDGLQMQVLLVAAKRELVESKVNLLSDAGLEAAVIDVDAFALHNAFEYNYPEAMKGIVALANIGHETTNVNILEEGVPILTREIAFGSRRLREDLQRERGLTAEQAEEVVQGKRAEPDLERFVSEAADEVSMGIERAAAFLMTQRGGESLGKVFLSGGGARIPFMAEKLAERMNVEAELVNPFHRVTVKPEVAAALPLDEMAPMLLLPMGLALRQS